MFVVNARCGVTFYIAEVIFLSPQGGQYLDVVVVMEENSYLLLK